MGWTSPYTYKGYTYKAGDPIVVNGNYYYDASDTTPNGIHNTTKYFHGVWVNDDGTLPLNPVGVRNSASNTTATGGMMRFESIISGGTGQTYKITINMNGGKATNNFTSMTPTMGTNGWYVFNGNQPTREGYTFKGLYTAASGGEQIYGSNGLATGDGIYWKVSLVGDGSGAVTYEWIYPGNVTLYAQWTANKYYVKYNANGGSGSMSNSTHTYNTASNLFANTFKRTGYTFNGWNTKADGTGDSYSDKASIKTLTSVSGGTVTLYAKWKANTYNIRYNANGGSGYMNNSTHTYGTPKALTENTFVKNGYTFNGWNTKQDGTGTVLTDKHTITGLTTTNNATVDIYAQWKANEYTLTLNANGGTVGTNSVKVTYDLSNYCEMSWNIPVFKGYIFKGWYTATNGGIQVYEANGYTSNDGTFWNNDKWCYAGDVILYAQWERASSVLLDIYANNEWKSGTPKIYINGEWKDVTFGNYINGTWKQ